MSENEKIHLTEDDNIEDIETIQNIRENTYKENRIRNNKKIILLITIMFLSLFILFIAVFVIVNNLNTNIISGIHVNGINLSNMSIDQAKEKLTTELHLNNTLHLTYQNYEATILPSEIDFSFDIDSTVAEAYSIGRNSNIFMNNLTIFCNLFSSNNVPAKYDYNKEKLDYIINNISLELPGIVVEPSYYIENESLIICKGSEGIKLKSQELKDLILSTISSLNSTSSEIIELTIPTELATPCDIDLDKIYQEMHTEPQNAYIEKDPFTLHLNVDGVDFAISMEEAKNLLMEDLNQYTIPLKITKADITVSDLGNELFTQTFSTYTSRYNVNNTNRSTNVEIATSKINNIIILPGETFSYNKTVGERTISAGFKEASIYTSNGIEYGLGGGICQVSSTLYNAVLEANLQVVERKNHRYSVSYVPLGCDATVSYGYIDFKFKNSRKYPIKLIASANNGKVSISIVGLKEDTEYDVSIVTNTIQTIPFETKYVYDSSLPPNKQVVKQKGSSGYKIETYKVVSLDNSIISKTLISTDTYSPLTHIICVGD